MINTLIDSSKEIGLYIQEKMRMIQKRNFDFSFLISSFIIFSEGDFRNNYRRWASPGKGGKKKKTIIQR